MMASGTAVRRRAAGGAEAGRRRALAVALAGMCAMAAALGIGRFVYTPILPSMAQALHLSKAAAGLLASANFLGYLLGALAAAAPRLPGARTAWLRGALACGVSSLIAMAATSDFAVLMALRFVAGVASAFIIVIATALVMGELAAIGRAAFSAIHFAGVGVGIAASAVIVAGARAGGVGWQGQWLIAGLVAAAGSLAALAIREGGGAAGPAGRATRFPDLPRFGLAYGLVGFGYSITATFLVTMLRASRGGGLPEMSVWMLVGLAAVPSVWGWSQIARRVGVRRAIAAAALVLGFGVSVPVWWPGASGLLAGAVLLGGTFMGITALGFMAAQDLAPEPRRRVTALLTAAFGLGQIVGPALAGFLADRTGSFTLPVLIATGALLVTAGALLRGGEPARLGTS